MDNSLYSIGPMGGNSAPIEKVPRKRRSKKTAVAETIVDATPVGVPTASPMKEKKPRKPAQSSLTEEQKALRQTDRKAYMALIRGLKKK